MRWPAGAASAGIHCGVKRRSLDLGALVFDEPVEWAGVFTTNAAAAAPVEWSRAKRGVPVRAVVVNSGNANACTGERGHQDVQAIAAAAAGHLICEPDEILVASTGPIGVHLPVDRIIEGLPHVIKEVDGSVDTFATSILTTDSTIKVATANVGGITVVGVAKGAAMIAPNMATMLAFLVTDAKGGSDALAEALATAVNRSFNRISIDGCESTNDSVFLFSTGSKSYEQAELATAVEQACRDLASQIVKDAEGGTKLVRITVDGAKDEDHAASLGRGVAVSDLWRAAVHGGDPNWGRILSALGAADRSLDMTAVSVAIGDEVVFSGDGPVGDLDAASHAMTSSEVDIRCSVGNGPGSAVFLCPDLSEEYVTLNAEVTT